MAKDVVIKLGDFQVLDIKNPINLSTELHWAYVCHNGMRSNGSQPVMVFEVGIYDEQKDVQRGNSYYLPKSEKIIDCRADTYERRVELEIVGARHFWRLKREI